MSNENNNQFNNEARENHDGQFGHGQKRPYNRPKNYKYKPQHRNSYGRKPMQDRKAPADKEKNGIQVPFKSAIKNSSRRPKKPTSKLKIIPLGGLEQIGMNITAFEYEDSIVVVDCGLAFPEDDMLGIDLVIPDVTYLKENISKVKGFVITHGHEDHIGALPYVLKDVNVPVYSTKLTIALIANKLKEHNMTNLDAAVKMGNVEFDDTYLDIIAAAKIDISRGVDSTVRKKYLDILQKISNGKVTLHEDRFYLKPGTQAKLEFNLVAEGLRKIALLWQLIKNGTLEKGSVLFWDEPEANINPKYIPVLAELLIMLETEGVQIFVSTHDYFLSKYIEVKRRQDSKLQYISLYKNENNKVLCEIAPEFELLEHNAIMDTFRQLYREEIGVALK